MNCESWTACLLVQLWLIVSALFPYWMEEKLFFLYDFFGFLLGCFFFLGNKIPQTNKIRSKKRQRIQFHFPKIHLRSHTTASSFSMNSSDQGRLAPGVLPATLICLFQQPSHQLLQVLPGFKLFLQTLFHPFVFLQGENQRNKDAVMPMHFMQWGTAMHLLPDASEVMK